MKFLSATTSTIVLALMLAAWPAISSAQGGSAICAGYTGAAYGQCTAAVAVGCDGSATQPRGCNNLAQFFEILTGNSPPWDATSSTTDCACWTIDPDPNNIGQKPALSDLFANEQANGLNIRWSYFDGVFGVPSKNLAAEAFLGDLFALDIAIVSRFDGPNGNALGACLGSSGFLTTLETPAQIDGCWNSLAIALDRFNATEDKTDYRFTK